MRLSSLLLTLAAAALPSVYAITCDVGTFIPNAAGQVDLNNNGATTHVMAWTCPTEATGCVTAYIRQAFNTEAPRLVIVSCQTEQECKSESQVVAPDHWYDIRCCTSNNCNREGLNNIDWSNRTPNMGTGDIPTFPSFPTSPTDQPQDNTPTHVPNDPFTPTQPATTQAPDTILRCRQGTITPAVNGEIGPDTDSWKSDTCPTNSRFCVTFFQRTDDQKLITANCAESCTPAVFVDTPTQWLETTCCSGDNCNNDISKLSTHDWSDRSMNTTTSPIATVPPVTQTPPATQTPGTTTSPTASPITGSTGTTSRPTIPSATSTGINNNAAFTTTAFSPFLVFILAMASFTMSF